MYRIAAKRLSMYYFRRSNALPTIRRPEFLNNSAGFCTPASNQNLSFSGKTPYPNSFQLDPSSTTSSSPETPGEAPQSSGTRSRNPGYEKEQARVLHAALSHVNSLGWTEAALMAGAREVGVSPSIVGAIPRKEAALVEYFMDDCLERLISTIESDVELKNLIPSERISKLVKIRLEMQVPYISKWPQALSIQALPMNIPTSFKQRAALVDEIWHAAGDDASDLDWYVKRTVLGGIYSTAEVYMLTDKSPDFRDTWAFLNARVRDAFDLKKTMQEAQNLAEAVGAGIGGSFQGVIKGVFKG